jgi:hypothetical protein
VLLYWRTEPYYMEIEFEADGAWSLFFEDMTDPTEFVAREYEGSSCGLPPQEAFPDILRFVSKPALYASVFGRKAS